jgi:hypothetical protein
MDTKILRGTLFGGIAFFFLGWLVYGILLADFSLSNYNQCMNRSMTDMVWWALIISNLVSALLITLILKWSGATSFIDGLRMGALFGLLFSISIDLSFYSMTTYFNNFSGIVADIVASTFMSSVTGAVIVMLWGKEKTI